MRGCSSLFAVPALVLALAGCTHISASQDWASRLEGWWDEGSNPAEVCAAGRNLHRKLWEPEKRRLTFVFERPQRIYDGSVVERVSYEIRRADGDVLTLFLEGETRRLASGEPIVWQLVFVEPGVYRWRVAGDYPFNRVWGRRCDRPGTG
jgi:hypothetical protein